jgi:hypothetical protein
MFGQLKLTETTPFQELFNKSNFSIDKELDGVALRYGFCGDCVCGYFVRCIVSAIYVRSLLEVPFLKRGVKCDGIL